jgi:hypothetical protein
VRGGAVTARAGALIFVLQMLGGCAGSRPPDEYAISSAKYYHRSHGGGLAYNQMIHEDDFPKPSFVSLFERTCGTRLSQREEGEAETLQSYIDAALPTTLPQSGTSAARKYKGLTLQQYRSTELADNLDYYRHLAMSNWRKDECGSGKSTSYECWAFTHNQSRECVDAMLTYTAQQCVAKTGVQNYFFAKANESLGYTLLGFGLAADAAAIINAPKASNSNSALATAALASSIENSAGAIQKVAPGNVTIKIADLQGSMQAYVVGTDMDDATLISCYHDGKWDGEECKIVFRQYAYLHDAVYSSCAVSAF